jgi:hypothetical protein
MASSSVQDRVAAFTSNNNEVKSGIDAQRKPAKSPDSVAAFQSNKNEDMTGIDAQSKPAKSPSREPKVHTSVKHPWSQTKSSRVDATGGVNRQADVAIGDNQSEAAPSDTPSGKDVNVHTSVKHPWSDRKSGRVDGNSKKADGDVESQKTPGRGRPSLKETSFDNISRRRLQAESQIKAKPVTKKRKTMQLLKCAGMSIFIAGFIIAASITIVTGWGDGSVETEYKKTGVIPGKFVALSQNGAVAVVEDDFGFNQVYTLDRNASPMWSPIGSTFTSRGRVELSEDGSTMAYVDTSQRLRFKEYDDVTRKWELQDAPFLTGDDLNLNSDFSLLTVGSYGLGSITNFNSKVGEGTITTYRYNDTDWNRHGSPLIKLFGLRSFQVSPDGTGMVTVAENDGNITLNGFKSFDRGNETYAWAKSDLTITLETSSADVAVSNEVYAVAFDKSVRIFSYSGRPWGQEIKAAGDANITAVALSLDGRTLVVGSVSEGMTGFVEWYEFPKGQDTNDNWVSLGTPLRDDGSETSMFGSVLDLNEDASQLAVQSGTEGKENVHYYDVTFKAARKI